MAVKLEIIDKAGAWFTVKDQRFQGRDAVKQYLRENPDICNEIEYEVRSRLMSAPEEPQMKRIPRPAGQVVDISAEDFEG